MEFKTISIEDIEFSQNNPRLTFADESLNELVSSIKRDGIIEPIVVRPRGLKYELIIGERRVRAAIQANISKLPAVVRDDVSEEEASRMRLVENINRKDLDVFEKVAGIKAHTKRFELSVEQVAEELNKTPETVKGWFRLAEATSPKIKIADRSVRKLGTQKLMEISKYDFKTQEQLAEKILASDLTVDQVRRFITLFESNPDANLNTLVNKVKEQVKTIEVTLPIEEAEKVLKRAEEVRKKEKKAEKKLVKHLQKREKLRWQSTQTEQRMPGGALATETVEVPMKMPSLKKLKESEIARFAEDEKFSADEVKRLAELERQNPDLMPRELVSLVKREMRPQVMVLEVRPKLYEALEAYADSQRSFVKEAALLLLEESLESHGYWKRGR